MGSLKKVSRVYTVSAVLLLNAALILLAANFALILVGQIARKLSGPQNPVFAKYGESVVMKAYPDLNAKQVNELLMETWSRPVVFEPFTEFKERPYKGKYVNVDKAGFRVSKDQGPWPPDPANFNVFLFGGSTVFCYGLPDGQTIASYLQESLAAGASGKNVRVYNFGQGNFYCVQERILLEKLLVAGHVLALAIFIDGLNEFYCVEGQYPQPLGNAPRLPIAEPFRQLAGCLARTLSPAEPAVAVTQVRQDETSDSKTLVASAITRYVENKTLAEAVCNARRVKAAFVWQPVPYYKYDLKRHPFRKGGFEFHSRAAAGYDAMARLVQQQPLGNNFLWCADIQEHAQEPLYVDECHYSAAMCEKLARAIAALLVERKVLD